MSKSKTPKKNRPEPYLRTPTKPTSVTVTAGGIPGKKIPTLDDVQAQRLYVFGGTSFTGGGMGAGLTAVEYFDFAESRWSTNVQPMPRARKRFGAAVFRGRIWTVGGCDELNLSLRTVDIYDPAIDQWATGTEMWVGREGVGLAVYQDTLFAVGGISVEELRSFETYNPVTDMWEIWVRELLRPRANLGMAVIGNMLLVIGGDAAMPGPPLIEFYQDTSAAWSPVGRRISRRKKCSAAVADECLFVTAGDGNRISRCRYYGVFLHKMQSIRGLSVTGADLASSNEMVFLVGGLANRRLLNTVFWYNWEQERWSQLGSTMQTARYEPKAVIVDRPLPPQVQLDFDDFAIIPSLFPFLDMSGYADLDN